MSHQRSPNEVQRAQAWARWLDDGFQIPGTRIRWGWDAILGLIPGVGDVLMAAMGLVLVFTAFRARIPAPVLARMILNLGVDLAIGSVPVVGDVFDIFWRSNRRNLRLLEKYQAAPRRVYRRSLGFWAVLTIGLFGLMAVAIALLLFAIRSIWLAFIG